MSKVPLWSGRRGETSGDITGFVKRQILSHGSRHLSDPPLWPGSRGRDGPVSGMSTVSTFTFPAVVDGFPICTPLLKRSDFTELTTSEPSTSCVQKGLGSNTAHRDKSREWNVSQQKWNLC
ncbi:hypothetical protein T484DRAFT_2930891 [Baffinella frigidus]|nr:hypothetical protein T484DRAFT_2930891 [Cryptophyta sp. CCMP2293]